MQYKEIDGVRYFNLDKRIGDRNGNTPISDLVWTLVGTIALFAVLLFAGAIH